jgi:hypothetical protein
MAVIKGTFTGEDSTSAEYSSFVTIMSSTSTSTRSYRDASISSRSHRVGSRGEAARDFRRALPGLDRDHSVRSRVVPCPHPSTAPDRPVRPCLNHVPDHERAAGRPASSCPVRKAAPLRRPR